MGPETDVDTLDEIMSSPKELKEELNRFDDKEICETNDENLPPFAAVEKSNPFSQDFDAMQQQFIGFNLSQTIAAPEFDSNPFEDNKLRDLIEEEGKTKVTSDLVEKMLSREHVFEKRDDSFEKEEMRHDYDEDLLNEFSKQHAQPFDLAAEVSKQVEAVAQAEFNADFQTHDNHQLEQNVLFDESNNSQG